METALRSFQTLPMQSLARLRPGFRVVLACGVFLAGPALAQDTLAEALTAFEKVRSAPETERADALAGLGPFQEAEVTGILLGELGRATSADYRIQVVETLGQRIREGVLTPLRDHLLRTGAGDSLRQACAEAMAAQGNQGIDLLAELVNDPPGGRTTRGQGIRRACLRGLSQADSERAWRVVAEQTLAGNISERLQVLRLLANAADTTSVRRAREICLRDVDLRIASAALRQLVEHGYSRAHRATLELHDRAGNRTPPGVREAMIHSMARILDRELYEPLLQQAASDRVPVQRAIAEVAPEISRDSDFALWLVTDGLQRPVPAERKAAARILASADPVGLGSALRSLRRRLRTDESQVELILTLHPMLAGDPTWPEDLLAMAGSSRPKLRTVGLGLLAELGEPAALRDAHRSLAHAEWTVRAAAYDYCSAVRDPSSIPLLIRRLDDETHRLREDLLDTLQALTGMRFRDVDRWEEWWRSSRDGFELPPIREWKRGSNSGSTISYYNIPLVSNRVAFLLDVSGSMSEKIGTGQSLSRLREAKRQLGMVIEQMPEDYSFNIIYYWDRVMVVLDNLERATPEVKARAIQSVSRISPRGATNISDALMRAFEDPEIDTIYLLTDGQPTAGQIQDPTELASAVARWNGSRRIRIHGISVGLDSALLKELADRSGGTYVYVR